MASFGVFKEKARISAHPGADRLELAEIGLYKAVVGKGQFQDGEEVLYIPEQAVLPEWLIEEMGLTGKLSGKQANRVKAVRLRGILSQGLVLKLDALEHLDNPEPTEDGNYADALGIVKWEPPIPVTMAGQVKSEAEMLRWTDIENIKRFPHIFEDGEPVVLTEKVHGTCLISTTFFEAEGERTEVISKGLSAKGLAFEDDGKNLYWRAVNGNPVRELARELRELYQDVTGREVNSVGVYGEVFGSGIQDLTYGGLANQPRFAVFDAQVRFSNGETAWVNTDTLRSTETEIEHVPLIWRGPYSFDVVSEVASGMEQVSGQESNIREGVVIRPENANLTWVDGMSERRKIAKFVTEEYLTRKGGTEYN